VVVALQPVLASLAELKLLILTTKKTVTHMKLLQQLKVLLLPKLQQLLLLKALHLRLRLQHQLPKVPLRLLQLKLQHQPLKVLLLLQKRSNDTVGCF
jgi:hypothetical protein